MRAHFLAGPAFLAVGLMFLAPGAASADVIFDPADADELAAMLAEATAEQAVCYGWNVQVDNVGMQEESIGSNEGAGVSVDPTCAQHVELNVYITYTSESSESEDSASYDVSSSHGGPTTEDMEALDLDWDSLTGEDPDIVIGKAVTALPLLAADTGIAEPIAAAPETGTAPADAQLTDDPGSDFWRGSGGTVLWGVGLMLAGGLFAWWVLKINRTRRRRIPQAVPTYVPDTVPPEFYQPPAPDPTPAEQPRPETQPTARQPEPPAVEERAAEPPAAGTAATESGAAESGSVAPATTEPAAAKPAAEPAATESGPTESGAAESGAAESGAPESAAEKPADTESEPASGDSAAVESAESATTEPAAESPAGEPPASVEPPAESPSAAPSTSDTSAAGETAGPEHERPAPPDQKNKE